MLVAILFAIAVSAQLTASEIQRRLDALREKRRDIKKVVVERAGD